MIVMYFWQYYSGADPKGVHPPPLDHRVKKQIVNKNIVNTDANDLRALRLAQLSAHHGI